MSRTSNDPQDPMPTEPATRRPSRPMRVGTETGSLVNHVLSGVPATVPAVGDGATILHWTDRDAGTVVAVGGTPKRPVVTVRLDMATRLDDRGPSERQDYRYDPDPDGVEYDFRLLPSGWRLLVDGKAEPEGPRVVFGSRQTYRDFSF